MKSTTINDCRLIDIDKHHSKKGNISVFESFLTLPFGVKRVYYLYDVPGGESRGGHAHVELEQLIIAASGSFKVELDDGRNKKAFILNRPYQGLYIVPGIWRELEDFSSGSVCLVLASKLYNEHDYIRDFKLFKQIKAI